MKFTLNQKFFVAAVFGIAAGFILAANNTLPFTQSLLKIFSLVASVFVGMLKMVIIPLIFSSIVVGISHLRHHEELHRVWQITLLFFLFTVTLATLLGLFVVNVFQPGKGVNISFNAATQPITDHLTAGGFLEQLLAGLFMNPIAAMAQGQILPTVIFAIFFGVALIALHEQTKTVSRFMEEFFLVMMKIISWIIEILPIGIFCLLAKLVATQDVSLFVSVGKFMLIVIFSTLFHGFVVLPIVLWVLGRMDPLTFFKGASEALVTAFSTSSSSATIPVTYRCATENLKVDKNIVGFVVPLGATVNMDGTALYEAIAAIFVANLVGIDLSLSQQVIVFLMAIIGSIGAPGIPSAGMVTMVMVLQSVGLPAEAIAILLPIDRVLDTVRTMVNVEGDLIGSVVVQNLSKKNLR